MFYKEMLKSSLVKLLLICLLATVASAKYSGGTGEPNNPYQIANVPDWNDLMKNANDWTKNFVMTADVDLQGVVITPIGNEATKFIGVFEGNGHIISNLFINQPGNDYIGAFGLSRWRAD